jgi:hypothetical protein
MNIKKLFKILMISVILLTGIGSAQAGVVKKAIAYTVLKRASTYLMTGQGRKTTITFLKKAIENPKVEAALASMLSYYMVTMPFMGGDSIAKRSRDIFIELNMNTAERAKTLNADIDLFKTNYIYLTQVILKEIENDRKYSCLNKQEIKIKRKKSDGIYPPYYFTGGQGSPVEEWDYASYKGLTYNARIDDHLEHDHIPSIGAVLKYISRRDKLPFLSRDVSTGLTINNNATAVEIHEDTHSVGRTYGYKKSNEIDQLSMFKKMFHLNYFAIIKDEFISSIDSYNLKLATVKDFAYYGLSVDLHNPKIINAMQGVFKRNYKLCLYD